jgi:ATP-dependent 26S proteasome regulatory subunit
MARLQDWSGAELENLANESVYTALRMKNTVITDESFNLTLHSLIQQHKGEN